MADQNFTTQELESEEWRDVPDARGYEISNLGRVRSYFKPGNREPKQTIPTILVPSNNTSGYPAIKMRVRGRTVRYPIHRLVLRTFIGPCPRGMEACHNDGNPSNTRLVNLRWDTRINNHKDRALHGTNGHKLTAKQVAEIRSKWKPYQYSQARLAREYGVSLGMVSLIIRQHSWRHLEPFDIHHAS